MRASIIPIENTAVTETTTQANPNTHTKCPEAVVALSMIIAGSGILVKHSLEKCQELS